MTKKKKMAIIAMLIAGSICLNLLIPRSVHADSPNPESAVGTGSNRSPTNGLGSWIWAPKVADNQTVSLWKSFEISDSSRISRAKLSMTADDKFTVFLDGHELGHGAEWRELFIFDLTPLLSSGQHVLAVKAFNSRSSAGMILGLQVDLADGTHIAIKSDSDWKVVPDDIEDWKKVTQAAPDWQAAVVKAPLGGSPWWDRPLTVNVMPKLSPTEVHH